eukprot:TRINITY_DN841_c0_g1_i1.p1 TRINITY_DN841_c0_g1~~TRINITY_DN841_c0_g1_i1.p1  ORF type:complete len:851 (-),score=206.93 TRINITY_DN841_c0_g1_i1:118-2670(-)
MSQILDDDTQLLSPLELQALSAGPPEDNVVGSLVSPRLQHRDLNAEASDQHTPRSLIVSRADLGNNNNNKKQQQNKKMTASRKLPVKLIAIIKKADGENEHDDEHTTLLAPSLGTHSLGVSSSGGGSGPRYKKRSGMLGPSDFKKTMLLLGDDWESFSDGDDTTTYGSEGDDGAWREGYSSKEYWIDPTWVIDENEQELIEKWEKRKRKKEDRSSRRKRKKNTETGEMAEDQSDDDTSTDTSSIGPLALSPHNSKKKSSKQQPKRSASLSPPESRGSQRRSSVIILSPVGMSKRGPGASKLGLRGSVAFYEELTLGQHILRNNSTRSASRTGSPRRNPLSFSSSLQSISLSREHSAQQATSPKPESFHLSSNEILISRKDTKTKTKEVDLDKDTMPDEGDTDFFDSSPGEPEQPGSVDVSVGVIHSLEIERAVRQKEEEWKASLAAEKAEWQQEREALESERTSLREENGRLRSQVDKLKQKRKKHKKQIRKLQRHQTHPHSHQLSSSDNSGPSSPVTVDSPTAFSLERSQPILRLKKRSLLLPHPTNNSNSDSNRSGLSAYSSQPASPTRALSIGATSSSPQLSMLRTSSKGKEKADSTPTSARRSTPTLPPKPILSVIGVSGAGGSAMVADGGEGEGDVDVDDDSPAAVIRRSGMSLNARKRMLNNLQRIQIPPQAEVAGNNSNSLTPPPDPHQRRKRSNSGENQDGSKSKSNSKPTTPRRRPWGSYIAPDRNSPTSGSGAKTSGSLIVTQNVGGGSSGAVLRNSTSCRAFNYSDSLSRDEDSGDGSVDFSISASAIPMRTRAVTISEGESDNTTREQSSTPRMAKQQSSRRMKRSGSDILGFCLHKK